MHGADPSMLFLGGENGSPGYYYLLTTGHNGQIDMARATTLAGLKNGLTKKVWSDATPSRCCDLWAPEIHYLDGSYG